jgi:Tol biopolymer transport system component
VFNIGYESRANLYTMPANGGSPKQLTFLNAFSVAGVWSPDGGSVAFASTEGGNPRVWMVNADGTSPHPLPTSDVSENYNLAWSPGSRLLYQKAGYKSFYAIDPTTRRQELFLGEDSFRFVCCPEYSPDGKRIVVYLSRPRRGLWTVDTEGLGQVLIHALVAQSDSNPIPIGWSSDGMSIYAYDGKRAAARGLLVAFGETVTAAKIVRISLNGGPSTTIVDLPFDEVGGVAMFPDGRRFVASVYSSRSDVWVVENFDVTAEPRVAQAVK